MAGTDGVLYVYDSILAEWQKRQEQGRSVPAQAPGTWVAGVQRLAAWAAAHPRQWTCQAPTEENLLCPYRLKEVEQAVRDTLGKKGIIYYVNGIATDESAFGRNLAAIQLLRPDDAVIGVHNTTVGRPGDLWESKKNKDAIDQARWELELLERKPEAHTRWSASCLATATLCHLLLAKAALGEGLVLWAHSQGGAIASEALFGAKLEILRHKTPPLCNPPACLDSSNRPATCKTLGRDLSYSREKLISALVSCKVRSFASAAHCWHEVPNCTHFLNVLDIVPDNYGIGRLDEEIERKVARKDIMSREQVVRFVGPGPERRLRKVRSCQPLRHSLDPDRSNEVPSPLEYVEISTTDPTRQRFLSHIDERHWERYHGFETVYLAFIYQLDHPRAAPNEWKELLDAHSIKP